MNVNVDDIIADPAVNCRLDVDECKLDELVASIRRHGLIHECTVRLVDDRPHLVTGFRRLMACKILGWTTIPCRILDVDEEQSKLINFEENLARSDLNPLEEALTLERIFPETAFSSHSPIVSATLSRSQFWIVSRRQILRLSPEHRQLVAAGRIPVSRVPEVLNSKCPDDTARRIVLRRSTKRPTGRGKDVRSRRAIRNMIQNLEAVHIHGLAVKALSWTVGETPTEELTTAIATELQRSLR